jgi:hypothetical protein
MFFEVLGGDFIQRAGWHLGGGNAQFFGLRKHFFAFDSKLLRYLVNTNGHNYLFSTGRKTWSSCAQNAEMVFNRHTNIKQP